MPREMTEWPFKRGPIAKIIQSDGRKGDTVPFAAGRWYDFPEFECHLGNVDSSGHPENLGSDGQAAIRPRWPAITFTPPDKMHTPWADAIVPLAKTVLLEEETS
jgi:hypothetical protein